MTLRTWRRVLNGSTVRRLEPYWYEGMRYVGEWNFNHNGFGTLLVTYDNCGVGFNCSLSGATIYIDAVQIEWNQDKQPLI